MLAGERREAGDDVRGSQSSAKSPSRALIIRAFSVHPKYDLTKAEIKWDNADAALFSIGVGGVQLELLLMSDPSDALQTSSANS